QDSRLDLQDARRAREVAQDLRWLGRVIIREDQRRRPLQHAIEAVDLLSIGRDLGQGVLRHAHLSLALAKLRAQLLQLRNRQATVVGDDRQRRAPERLLQLRNGLFLLRSWQRTLTSLLHFPGSFLPDNIKTASG